MIFVDYKKDIAAMTLQMDIQLFGIPELCVFAEMLIGLYSNVQSFASTQECIVTVLVSKISVKLFADHNF